jgi:hypothetical protein
MAGSATPRGLLLWSDMGAVLLQDSECGSRTPAGNVAWRDDGADQWAWGGVHDDQLARAAIGAGDIRRRAETRVPRGGRCKCQSAMATRSIGALLTWPKSGAGNVRSGAAVRVMP